MDLSLNKYYRMRTDSNPDVVGVTDNYQVEIVKSGFEDKELYERIRGFFNSKEYRSREDKKPEFEVEIQCVKARKKAKMTSVMSYTPGLRDCRFLISDDVRQCFERLNIQKHYLYRTNVLFKDQVLKYWMFHCPAQGYEVIDFKDCVFYTGSPLTGKKYYSVNDQVEYQERYIDKAVLLWEERIALNEKFDRSLDFFVTKLGGEFVSERLRSEFIKNGFTGANFIPAFGDDTNQVMIKIK